MESEGCGREQWDGSGDSGLGMKAGWEEGMEAGVGSGERRLAVGSGKDK